jgi:hypothetical protein
MILPPRQEEEEAEQADIRRGSSISQLLRGRGSRGQQRQQTGSQQAQRA